MSAVVHKDRQYPGSGESYHYVDGVKRGMVFWAVVAVREARGEETRHDNPSPWLIVSNDSVHKRFPIVQAVPLTSSLSRADAFRDCRIYIGEKDLPRLLSDQQALSGDSLALTEQVRVLAHARLKGQPVAKASSRIMNAIDAGLLFALGIPA